jgi:hypothetical protein
LVGYGRVAFLLVVVAIVTQQRPNTHEQIDPGAWVWISHILKVQPDVLSVIAPVLFPINNNGVITGCKVGLVVVVCRKAQAKTQPKGRPGGPVVLERNDASLKATQGEVVVDSELEGPDARSK